MKGQALVVAALRSYQHIADFGLAYQAYRDPTAAATTVAKTALYPIMTEFKGNTFTVVLNINQGTACGSAVVSAASYAMTLIAIEVPTVPGEVVKFRRLLGEYVTNQGVYTGSYPARHVTIAVDNAELTSITTTVAVGGKSFADSDVATAEDVFSATLPDGVTFGSSWGATFATVPPVNPQTANALGIASFGGPTPSIVSLSFSTAPTLMMITDIDIA